MLVQLTYRLTTGMLVAAPLNLTATLVW